MSLLPDPDSDDRELVYERDSSSSAIHTHAVGEGFSRPHRDVPFARAFVATAVTTMAIGIAASFGRARDFEALTSDAHVSKWSSCHDVTTGNGALRRSLMEDDDAEVGQGLRMAQPFILAAALGAIGLGALALHAFQRHPRAATWGMIYAKAGSLFAMSIVLASAGAIVPCVIFALLGGFFLYWMQRTSERVELVAKLLGAASASLKDNPHLITTSLIAGAGVVTSIIVFFFCIFAAFENGGIRPGDFATRSGDVCYDGPVGDALTQVVPCCEWRPDSWVPWYVTQVMLVAMWSWMIAAEIRTFVIGGVVSRWYFAPVGTTQFVGTTREFVGHAFGPSFGSLAFGGLVLTGVQILRNLNERLRRESRGALAILACVVTMIMDCVAELVETVTKFATIQCAITGESLCDAGREVTRLLKDNFLSAVRVWWLPEMILNMAAFFISVFYGTTVGIFVDIGDRFSQTTAISVGFIAGVSSLVVLGFLFSVILTCVDAVFICYARDKDQNTVTKPDIVEIYDEVTEKTRDPIIAVEAAVATSRPRSQLPSEAGVVLQHPGAPTMAYGRPDNSR